MAESGSSVDGLVVRVLDEGDAEASRRLGHEAFGVPATAPTEPARVRGPGAVPYGLFDGDRLVARMLDRAYDSWFGGREVPTSGIAGVTVVAEYRGQGLLTPLFDAVLAAARDRGAVISTLFPTAPRIYRRFGYEVVSDYATVQVPSHLVAAIAPGPTALRTRRAEVADVGSIHRVYDTWAAAQNGPLTRRGASFPTTPEEYLDSFTGVTVAVDAADQVVGFASWDRGEGYGDVAVLQVSDLLALTGEGYRALWRALGSFASVTGQVKIDTSGADVPALFLPTLRWSVDHSDPYMLGVLDVPGALAARGFPAGLDTEVGFAVVGHRLAGVDGSYRLRVGGGRGECERSGRASGPAITPQGLALLYAGVQLCANLRFAGHLSGGSPAEDGALDLCFGGRAMHIRDYF